MEFAIERGSARMLYGLASELIQNDVAPAGIVGMRNARGQKAEPTTILEDVYG